MTTQYDTQSALSRASRPRWLSGVLLVTISTAALVVSGIFGVSRATTLWHDVQETGRSGYLSLRSDHETPYWQDLRPGQQITWQIEASLQDAESSTLDLELRSAGDLVEAGNMLVQVSACDDEFVIPSGSNTPTCTTGHVEVLQPTLLADIAQPENGRIFPLAKLHADAPRYLLVTLGVSAVDPQTIAHTSMTIGVGLHASGDHSIPPMVPAMPDEQDLVGARPPLVATGLDAIILVLLGIGFAGILLGGYLVKTSRERP